MSLRRGRAARSAEFAEFFNLHRCQYSFDKSNKWGLAYGRSMAQQPSQSLDLGKILEAVLATVKAQPYCFLITLDESGKPQARMVAAARVEPDLRIWIITSPGTRKVKEIRRDDRATMAFSDNKGEGYATLIGHARLVNDLDQKKTLWKFGFAAFFPGGPEGDDSILIEFVPDRIEVMHFHLKVGTWPWEFKPASLFREGESWVLQR